jgi:hypothetical protein
MRPAALPGLFVAAALAGCAAQTPPPAPAIAAVPAPLPPPTCAGEAAAPLRGSGADWAERRAELARLGCYRRFAGSPAWRLGPNGVELRGQALKRDRHVDYRLGKIEPVWERFGPAIAAAARRYGVPAELIVTVIVEETGGNPGVVYRYRGYVSDAATPSRISLGIGGMLLSVARAIAPEERARIDRAWMLKADNAIDLIGRLLHVQYKDTGFDPPIVAAVYNAGGLYARGGTRWHMVNSTYVDSSAAVVSAAQRYLAGRPDRPAESFAALFGTPAPR